MQQYSIMELLYNAHTFPRVYLFTAQQKQDLLHVRIDLDSCVVVKYEVSSQRIAIEC